jgi:hypothetical protein
MGRAINAWHIGRDEKGGRRRDPIKSTDIFVGKE